MIINNIVTSIKTDISKMTTIVQPFIARFELN